MADGRRRGETRYQASERLTQSCAGAIVGSLRLAGGLSRRAEAAYEDRGRRRAAGRPHRPKPHPDQIEDADPRRWGESRSFDTIPQPKLAGSFRDATTNGITDHRANRRYRRPAPLTRKPPAHSIIFPAAAQRSCARQNSYRLNGP